MSRALVIAWGLLGVLALGLWLGLTATARSRADLLEIVATADRSRPRLADLDAAGDLLFLEMSAPLPDPRGVALAWAVLAVGPDADGTRTAIGQRSEELLARELALARPDPTRLRLAHDLAAVLGPEPAAAAHARIAARAGDRGAAAAELAAAAERLRSAGTGATGAATVARIAGAWAAMLRAGSGSDALTWAARETPPVADALAAAGDALRQHLDALVQDPHVGRAGLQATWDCLHLLDQAGQCPPELVARYAAAMRRDRIPPMGLVIAVSLSSLLFGGAALAYRRLSRGVRTIDPGAETMEDVDAVDLDTDAVTVQRNTTGEETRVD